MVIADNGKWLTPEEVLGWTYGDTPINSLSTGELLAREAITTPGGNFHYSQPGYVSLGLMIETVTGQLLADVFAERIFTPLAMLDSRLASIDEPHDPVGYTNLFGNLDSKVATSSVVSSLNSTNSSAWSAGGVVSTSNDLVKFLPALLDGRLLSEESMQLMQDWQEASSNRFSTPDWHYGMGLSRTVRDGYVFVGHGGAVPGSGSVMQYIEDYDIYVIAVRNTDEDAVADGTPDLTEYVVQALLNNSQ